MDMSVNLTSKLLGVTEIFGRTSDVIFAQLNITFAGYEILKHIDAGTTTTTALARIMNGTLSSITHKTKALGEDGFIERSFDEHDERVCHFGVTQEGMNFLKLIESIYREATRELYFEFTNFQKLQVLDFLNKIENHLDRVLLEDKTALIGSVRGLAKNQLKNLK